MIGGKSGFFRLENVINPNVQDYFQFNRLATDASDLIYILCGSTLLHFAHDLFAATCCQRDDLSLGGSLFPSKQYISRSVPAAKEMMYSLAIILSSMYIN